MVRFKVLFILIMQYIFGQNIFVQERKDNPQLKKRNAQQLLLKKEILRCLDNMWELFISSKMNSFNPLTTE